MRCRHNRDRVHDLSPKQGFNQSTISQSNTILQESNLWFGYARQACNPFDYRLHRSSLGLRMEAGRWIIKSRGNGSRIISLFVVLGKTKRRGEERERRSRMNLQWAAFLPMLRASHATTTFQQQAVGTGDWTACADPVWIEDCVREE